LIANKDGEIGRLEAVYTANLEKAGVRIVKTRAVRRAGSLLVVIIERSELQFFGSDGESSPNTN